MFFEYDNVYQLNVVYDDYKITKKINKPLKIRNNQESIKYYFTSKCHEVLFHCGTTLDRNANGVHIRLFHPYIVCCNDPLSCNFLFFYDDRKKV